jgi:hypothetical protein
MRTAVLTFLMLIPETGILTQAQDLLQGYQEEPAVQQAEKAIEGNGYTRGSVYGGGKTYDYASVFGEFCLRGKWSGKNALLFSDLRIRSGLSHGDEYTLVQLKEAYAGYTGDKLDVILGNQIITWGRADGVNPTNNITPNDYFFLSADPDDQKLPGFMLRTRYRLNHQVDLDVVLIPFYVMSVYRFDLFALGEGVEFAAPVLPEKTFKNGTIAARLNAELTGIGFSLSFFRGYDPYHGFDVQEINWPDEFPLVTNVEIPYLKNTLGADLALPFKTWIARGEIAFDITKGSDTNMCIPASSLTSVLGLEHNFGGITAIIQYMGEYIPGFTTLKEPVLQYPNDPPAMMAYTEEMIRHESAQFNRKIFSQQERTNHALMLTLHGSWGYDAWTADLTGIYNFTSDEYLISPRITWKISDVLAASAGFSYMQGPDKSVFRYAGPVLNGFFFELKANF